VYLVSFDFFCPSKCGSYFCRTLYKIGIKDINLWIGVKRLNTEYNIALLRNSGLPQIGKALISWRIISNSRNVKAPSGHSLCRVLGSKASLCELGWRMTQSQGHIGGGGPLYA
jgi:hypothetical protein